MNRHTITTTTANTLSLWLLQLSCWIVAVSCVSALSSPPRYIGFDLGTSGARISIVERRQNNGDDSNRNDLNDLKEIYTQAVSWTEPSQKDSASSFSSSYDYPEAWIKAVETLLQDAASSSTDMLSTVQSICVSGTSASCLMVDIKANKVTRKPRMYNYDVVAAAAAADNPVYALKAMKLLDKYAPPRHTARARTGSLAKLLTWNEESPLGSNEVLCHQADYVAMLLRSNDRACGAGPANTWTVSSDWHNCLKLGYDVQQDQWPTWLTDCLQEATNNNSPLPRHVISPGLPLGTISKDMASRLGLPQDTVIVGGTTDSNAAFLAATKGSPEVGTAVTSLGSTLAIKYLAENYIEDADRGVYSHRFPSVFLCDSDSSSKDNTSSPTATTSMSATYWLAGGASNVGCAVLRQQEFSNDELATLSQEIDPNTDSPLGDTYYPLTKVGERFPVADSNKKPVLVPVPDNRRDYLHAILQGIANVERDGFQILADLGASPSQPHVVWTCGGGSQNDMWSQLRERRLNEAFKNAAVTTTASTGQPEESQKRIHVFKAENTEAGFGAALLAAAAVPSTSQISL